MFKEGAGPTLPVTLLILRRGSRSIKIPAPEKRDSKEIPRTVKLIDFGLATRFYGYMPKDQFIEIVGAAVDMFFEHGSRERIAFWS